MRYAIAVQSKMEPPLKRLRLDPSPYAEDEENQDELAMTPAQFETTQDPMYQLDKGRARAATRLKSTFEDIFAKYGKDFDGDDDVINFYTDEIEVDNGHVQSLELRKDGATEDALSGDEEDRILNGKSDGQRKKPRSKSLMPAKYTGYNQSLQFRSPWNGPPGLGTHRLSSLAFSSPFGSPPPFHFQPSIFGTSHVDPVWQAPDLPVQPPCYPYGSLIGIGGSQFASFGGLPNHVAKRLASAKSFLRDASTSSKANNGDAEEEGDEEDDIILGRSRQETAPLLRLEDREEVHSPATSRPSSYQSSRSPGQQPPFPGIGLTEDKLHAGPDDIRKEAVTTAGIVLAPHQSAEEDKDAQHHQTARSSHGRSPSRHKRGRPKKSDTRKSSNVLTEEARNEIRALQPNERRIEIIIPIMKRLSPTQVGQPTEGTALIVDQSPQPSGMERGLFVDADMEVACPQDSLHTSQTIGSLEDVVHQPSTRSAEDLRGIHVKNAAQITDDPKHAASASKFQGSQQQQSKQTQKRTDTQRHDGKSLENTCVEASRESGSEADSFMDNTPAGSLHEMGQKSDRDNGDDRVTPGQRLSPIANVDVSEEQATRNTNVEGSVETAQAVQHSPKEVSVSSAFQTEVLGEGAADGSTEKSNLPTTEMVVLETTISQEPECSRSENEDVPRDEPTLLPLSFHGEQIFPIHSHAPDNTTTPNYDVRLKSVLESSEVVDSHENPISAPEQDVGFRSPKHPVMRALRESDRFPGQDCLLPSSEPSEIRDNQERNASNQSVCTSVLVAEIGDLQLDSDHQDAQRSPSLGAVELPDQDLSIFPAKSDAHSTSEFVLPLSLRPTKSDEQNSIGIGRAPSPELGIPIRSRITSKTPSRTKITPAPATPTRKQGSRGAKHRSSHHRTPSSKRFPLTSLIPEGIDDESDDELSIAGSFSSTTSRLFSPFFRPTTNENHDLPPLLSTPRNKTRKHSVLTGSPSSSARTPNRTLWSRNIPPATESRAGSSKARRGRNRLVHSSPLARRVAERLLSSPTKRHHVSPTKSPSMVPSPHGTLRRCGEDGFECGRDFCFTCCI
ncbi:hypothetical protein F4824DRAFT_460449 [Ustulina deusta]|nr:hypothetical protein F4824DRAFT_460449 [Ustulina deusta]